MKTLRRIGITAAAVLFVLAAAAVVMFSLGRPVAPQVSSETAAPAEVVDAQKDGQAGSDPLAIEVPGCVCHSDDPDLVAQHATYRMSECFGCHQGGMPEMEQ